VDRAYVDGAIHSAIEVADAAFPSGASDFLTRGCVDTTEEKSISWKFIIR
jgi:hypothetical protein